MSTGGEARRIVVGIDGSAQALEALRWAAREAELRGADLLVVLAWQVPVGSPYVPTVPLDAQTLEDSAKQTLEHALSEVFGAKLPDGVSAEIRQGPASAVLIEAGKEADLLIVGSRGHGGLVGALLGSVSTAIVHHAHCPVLVVREPHREG
ncbi:universal stress protein [Frankia sp. AgB1.9]|uniref:universal stress protein n=1 Tax=unclassified Frankia TaxID=2632575 RepID=UPI00193317A9|nr:MULTISPECIES: universal stress protein [unclassified Frankia]MBL7491078.1 universal stress protein [Frankia sp. AgW1.1]MBL7553114.1 universal stress protein [Frankia sp. AgB1.9]MBL7623029.1 universal stress protein [Frankia sp. AgB1.8]